MYRCFACMCVSVNDLYVCPEAEEDTGSPRAGVTDVTAAMWVLKSESRPFPRTAHHLSSFQITVLPNK